MRKAIKFLKDTETSGRIHIPHYWALYVHDGRGTFEMPTGLYMVWFKDPRLDPRLVDGETPARASQLRSLRDFITPEEFHQLRITGQIIIAARVTKRTPPKPFFSNEPGGGMQLFSEAVNQKFGREVQDYILDQIGRDILNVKDTATLTL